MRPALTAVYGVLNAAISLHFLPARRSRRDLPSSHNVRRPRYFLAACYLLKRHTGHEVRAQFEVHTQMNKK